MRIFIAAFAALLLTGHARAHAPVVDQGQFALTAADPFLIDEPEHSKAIFSQLSGEAHFYRIYSDKPFRFYAGVTQPKLAACDLHQTFSFEVLNADMQRIDGRDGARFVWWAWYEEYGKSWYWVGPEIGQDFKGTTTYEAGTYYIRVFNQNNTGHYVLAVGDEERFGFGTVAGMVLNRTMSKVRNGWWDNANCP